LAAALYLADVVLVAAQIGTRELCFRGDAAKSR